MADDSDDSSDSPAPPLSAVGPGGNNESPLDTLLAGGTLSTDDIYTLLRTIALASVPQRQGFALEGLNQWMRRAQGSPTALLQQFGPQIRQIREQLQAAFQGVSRRLGPAGGAQIARGESQALGDAGLALSRLFSGGVQEGTGGMLNFLRALRPALLQQLPTLTSVQGPADYTSTGRALAGAAGFAGQLFPQQQTTTPDNPTVMFTPSDVYLGGGQVGPASSGFATTTPVYPEF